ncbi:uncharacterized protein LOC113352451 [Papaver somniferum]|uniref:uncharacterized protein LOC113352451 n=1 Tax=Papaver somniferum TaxID=3469 RepID=UPI000E701DFB|nr:uncharacterized protein LOC113352451 [Papaver somniferum]
MEEHTETPDNSTMESLESHLECLGIEPYCHEGSSSYIENHYESTGLVETDLENPQPISPLAQESCDLMAEFSTDEVFASREEVIKWCHDKETDTKTVVIIRKSKKKSKIQGSFIVMACERFGEYKNVNRSVEKSVVTRCLRRKPRTTGTKKCRLNLAEKDLCISFSVGGVKPALILSTLKRQNKKNVSTTRTIYNAKSKFRTKVMEGRTKMQKLLQLLDEHHYVTSNRREDSSGRVLELFWSHPDGSRLAQCFPTILLLDCTYKTNRWGMSLFHVVGVTSTTQCFTIAYCFMSAEKTENYIWALERLRKLYSPNHLPSVVVTDDDIRLQNAILYMTIGSSFLWFLYMKRWQKFSSGKIRMKYEACTELQKHFMLEMLIEIADPGKTNMQEPKEKFASRGRPTIAQTEAQKKRDASTKRDLSDWERPSTRKASAAASKKVQPRKKAMKSHVVGDEFNSIDLPDLNAPPDLNEVAENGVLPSKTMSKKKKAQCTNEPKQRRKYTKKIKTNSPDISYDDEYLQHMVRGINLYNPKILTDVVERLENVAPDGHCGFRACAEMLGLSDDDGWKTVKIEMERELTMYPDMYVPIIDGMTEYNSTGWFLPDMGYIFASAFKCIFSSYSNMGCATWLPLRTQPPEDFKVVTIFNLNNEHFVKAILKRGASLPHVLNGWNSICTEEALLWTPHMEMLHRGWENIEQKQPGQGLHVIEDIDLDENLQVIEDIDLDEP